MQREGCEEMEEETWLLPKGSNFIAGCRCAGREREMFTLQTLNRMWGALPDGREPLCHTAAHIVATGLEVCYLEGEGIAVSCRDRGCFTELVLWTDELKVKLAQWCLILWDPIDYTVHGILQAIILEWVAFPFSRGSSQPRDQTQVSHTAGRLFTSWATKEAPDELNLDKNIKRHLLAPSLRESRGLWCPFPVLDFRGCVEHSLVTVTGLAYPS